MAGAPDFFDGHVPDSHHANLVASAAPTAKAVCPTLAGIWTVVDIAGRRSSCYDEGTALRDDWGSNADALDCVNVVDNPLASAITEEDRPKPQTLRKQN